MRKQFGLVLLLAGVLAAAPAWAADPLSRGTELLQAGDATGAEAVLRPALAADPESVPMRNQLALALIKQGRFAEADVELAVVLSASPRDVGARWYRAASLYEQGSYRPAVAALGEVLPDLPPSQVASAHWMIGDALRRILEAPVSPEAVAAGTVKVGLTSAETDVMIASFEAWLGSSPPRADAKIVRKWLRHVKKLRPPPNVERWAKPTSF